ncbi:MAG: hypothetical protein WC444_05280 [Candidatus Paceibacterota bacterium]
MGSTIKFVKSLLNTKTESEVTDCYVQWLNVDMLHRVHNCDGVDDVRGVIFEFKFDYNMKKQWSRCTAQVLHYVRSIYKDCTLSVPKKVSIADKNEAFIVSTKPFEQLIQDDSKDWSVPSNPSQDIIDAVEELISTPHIYSMTDEYEASCFMKAYFQEDNSAITRTVNAENVCDVYRQWNSRIKKTVLGSKDLISQILVSAFFLDLQNKYELRKDGRISWNGETMSIEGVIEDIKEYNDFWSVYKRITTEDLSNIMPYKDTLIELSDRRNTGEVNTPPDMCLMAHSYLQKAALDYDSIYFWDCCAGTGNLVKNCRTPPGKIFASTLMSYDVENMIQHGVKARIFQLDFLNDDIPKGIHELLTNDHNWAVLINPPWAGDTSGRGHTIKGVTGTKTQERMQDQKITCNNLYPQFMFRLTELMPEGTVLGIFTPASFLVGQNYESFRKFWFSNWKFVKGSGFQTTEFSDIANNWPVLFTVWVKGKNSNTINIDIVELDVLERDKNGALVKTGTKGFGPAKDPLNKWINRPKNTVVRPPMKSALNVVEKGRLNRLSEDAIGYLLANANEVQHRDFTEILSGPYANSNGWSITPENFEQSMTVFTIRRLTKGRWLNNKDQYNTPDTTHPEYRQFAVDAVIWSLFHNSNQSSSLGGVQYNGNSYDIKNEFFWVNTGTNQSFVSKWVESHKHLFSSDVRLLIDSATRLVTETIGYRNTAPYRLQLTRDDAGWYQVRKWIGNSSEEELEQYRVLLKDIEKLHKEIGNRLRPIMYRLGCLPPDFKKIDVLEPV